MVLAEGDKVSKVAEPLNKRQKLMSAKDNDGESPNKKVKKTKGLVENDED